MSRFALVLLLAAACGCSSEHPSVSGAVTLDGAPLADGTIEFVPTSGDAPRTGATIQNGRYTVSSGAQGLRHGVTYTVSIRSRRETGRSVKDPTGKMVKEGAEAVDPRFNGRSTLTVTVNRDSPTHDFAVSAATAAPR